MTAPYWSNGIATLYQADARAMPLPDRSVHCVVTSPPYHGLRDYGLGGWESGDADCDHTKGAGKTGKSTLHSPSPNEHGSIQGWPNGICGKCGATQQAAGIGLEPTLSDWLANIVAVSREVWRVLRDDGSFWLNLGDSYSTGASGDQANKPAGGLSSNQGSRRTKPARELPPKNLMGQPWRVAFALQEDGAASVTEMYAIRRAIDAIWDAYDGARPPDKVLTVLERMRHEYVQAKGNSWYLRSAIVWHKPNPMPESVLDRPTSAYEMVFLLTKRAHYFYDAHATREHAEYGRGSLFRSERYQNNHAFDNADDDVGRQTNYASGQGGRNARNVWSIPTQGRPEAHFATYPDELPRRCILAGTSEHGVCADCGAQWARQTETHDPESRLGKGYHDHTDDLGKGQRGVFSANGAPTRQTVGWQPTCQCNAARIPATVLDCFVGSGTTVAVAQQLGRHGIGLDLNPVYLAIAAKRLTGITLPMAI